MTEAMVEAYWWGVRLQRIARNNEKGEQGIGGNSTALRASP